MGGGDLVEAARRRRIAGIGLGMIELGERLERLVDVLDAGIRADAQHDIRVEVGNRQCAPRAQGRASAARADPERCAVMIGDHSLENHYSRAARG